MSRYILPLALAFFILVSAFEVIAIASQGQRIKQLENNIMKLHANNEELKQEQEKQARILAQDLYIYVNGFESGK